MVATQYKDIANRPSYGTLQVCHYIYAKDQGVAIVDTFCQSETNVYCLLKITNEEQLTLAAIDLVEAIRGNSTFGLDNKTLRKNISDLVLLF